MISKAKLVWCLLVVFLMGAATGGFLTWGYAHERFSKPPSPRKMSEFFRARLQTELRLTPDQLQQINPILDALAKDMDQVRHQAVQQIEARMQATTNLLNPFLTLQQKEKLAEMECKRKEMIKHHGS